MKYDIKPSGIRVVLFGTKEENVATFVKILAILWEIMLYTVIKTILTNKNPLFPNQF